MEPLTDKELKRIKEMDRIIGRNLPLIREEVSRDEAHKRITPLKESYKLENLDSIKEDPITIYHIGKGFTIFRLNIVWKRIYGTAWESEDQLKAFIHFKKEAKRQDHMSLSQVPDLFSIQNDAGGGLVFSHPRGVIVRHVMKDLWKKIHIECGYDMLYTPHVAKLSTDELPYRILVYKRKPYSYHEFPIRVAE
ncbi:hypothetical protein C1H46_013618 [Malus baccata]|uniref:Uncharacterized protein n=1 Tax=Malus baccata TaxID=106549 RepID=A0A540MRF0_MALBA|nr:hypothetical protein C1H46_013618 [Malus baccata]